MIPLNDQNHYEVLEISPDASPEEIERAYRVARSCYADDSLALYSLFDQADAAALRERIDQAYRVLSDRDARRGHDAKLTSRGAAPAREPRPRSEPRPTVRSEEMDDSIDDFDDIEDSQDSGEYDGARLRRARLRRGMELDQIAGATKVNARYLRYVEEERYDELPSSVYVRGFVTSYARAIGLDPSHVVGSYMARFAQAREGRERGAGSLR